MSLRLSSSFSHSKNPVNSTVLPDQAYVLSLVALRSHYAASASAPSNAIHVFDKSDIKRKVQTLAGHDIAITGLRSIEALAGTHEVLLSCGKDGAVRAWDERTGSVAVEMSTSGKRRALLSCDATSDGMTVAVGTDLQGDDAYILYWDPRNPAAPLRSHSSTHSDDITAVHFSHLGSQNVLLSASSDGLITTSNPEEENEDEAGLHVGNWGCSVSQVGWINTTEHGPQASRIWASSDMETFSSWSNELDLLQDVDRSRFTYPDPQLTWVTDYIVDCHSARNGPFSMFAGSNEGDIVMMQPSKPFNSNSQWSLERMYSTRHEGVVRSLLWDEDNNLLLTGGEDAHINAWSCPAVTDDDEKVDSHAMDVDSPLSRKRGRDDEDNARVQEDPDNVKFESSPRNLELKATVGYDGSFSHEAFGNRYV